ncbi:hypothetical protein SK854_17160 [Lentzea sp. BCCO 10_0061]|uniref:Uncharacterized protein n=1 Tax=Lentzea sokolovensis TaxID=3095429 RepID=A0ABU4UWI2_9PSEU|nr:hypothetical protein [Lentzea sp. BCCO 10_0061]MDX8143858.1 hypothetical protein [Lentzea sp. BCCO 10_0061]
MGEIEWIRPPRLAEVVAAYQGFAFSAGVRTGLVGQLAACSAEDPAAALAQWAAEPGVQPDLVSWQSARDLVKNRYRGKIRSQGSGALIWALPAAVRRLDADRIRELVELTHGPDSAAAEVVIMLASHLFTTSKLEPPDADVFTAAGALAQAVRGEGRGVARAIAGALEGGPEHDVRLVAEELYRRSW